MSRILAGGNFLACLSHIGNTSGAAPPPATAGVYSFPIFYYQAGPVGQFKVKGTSSPTVHGVNTLNLGPQQPIQFRPKIWRIM